MRRRAATVAVAMLAALLLAACAEYENYTPNAVELTALAEQYQGEDKEAVQGTAVARYLAAEQARIQQEQARAIAELAQATANAAEAEAAHQVTMMTAEAQQTIDARNAQATAQAAVATAQAAGTAQALAVRATEQAMSAQATQAAEAATRTAEARNAQATATERAYRATATQQAHNQQGTATLQAYNQQATHTAATATVRVQATIESQQATAQVAHATMTRQAEKREAVLGYGRDYGIPLILLVIAAGIGAFAVWGVREIKQRPVICEPSIFGDGQKLRIPDATGKKFTFVDMDLLPGPTLTVTRAGDATAPALRDEEREERVKAGDQAVDMATRPKFGQGHRGAPVALPAPRSPSPAPGLRSVRVLRRLDQAGRGGLLPRSLLESLAADWEE